MVTPEEVGPIDVQVPNGVVDIAVADEAEAVQVAKQYLSYFQGRAEWSTVDATALRSAVPENRVRSYDVRAVIDAVPDTTIAELQRRLVDERGVYASTGTIWTFLDRCDLTVKKKSAYATEQERPDVVEEREDWFDGQLDLDPEKLLFVDESFATTNMARRYGRAPRGLRLRAAIPHGNRKKTTLVAGREMRRPSQTVTPSPNEMFGPSTTTYSSGCWASQGSRRSVVSTDWQPGGSAPSSRLAVVLSGSTMTGIYIT